MRSKSGNDILQAVKQAVTVTAAVDMYLPCVKRSRGRIPCPIHNGKDYNCTVTDSYFHCFVCGAGGDVISFVRQLFSIDCGSAIRKLNDDFCLGLPLDRKATVGERLELKRKRREYLEKRKAEDDRKAAELKRYHELWDEWIRLDKQRILYAPKPGDEEFDPRFVEAMRGLEAASYRIDSEEVISCCRTTQHTS